MTQNDKLSVAGQPKRWFIKKGGECVAGEREGELPKAEGLPEAYGDE